MTLQCLESIVAKPPTKDARATDRRKPKQRKLKLASLREKQGFTQEELAQNAKIAQSAVSRTELRDDCLISTLERYINALGGKLKIHAEIDGTLHPVIS